jgi:hypothetical protein
VTTITGLASDGAFDVGILNNSADRSGGNPSLLTGINDGSDATTWALVATTALGAAGWITSTMRDRRTADSVIVTAATEPLARLYLPDADLAELTTPYTEPVSESIFNRSFATLSRRPISSTTARRRLAACVCAAMACASSPCSSTTVRSRRAIRLPSGSS